VYDIEIDTSVVTPEQAADAIGTLIQSWPDVTAFERLR
jgi:hypothetical protein